MKEVSNRISVHGNKLSPSVAADVLKEHGLKATKANIEKLVDLSADRDSNKYLKRSELEKGAAKLAKELGGGGGIQVRPDQPLSKVIDAVPANLQRYRFSLEDTDNNKTLDMLRVSAVPLRAQQPRDPRVRAMGATAKSIHEQIGHDFRGNITLQFAGDDGKLVPFKNGKWLTMSFKQALEGRPTAKEDLARLRAQGYDVNAQRDLLAVTVKGKDEPFIFGLRGPQDKKAPQSDDGRRVASFPMQNIDKHDYGFVGICNEVQIEAWGDQHIITMKKPVIYVYPEKKTSVRVTVQPNGEFSAQYPAAKNGTWEMVATPDGTLFDPKTEKKYTYLFWEGLNGNHLGIDPSRSHLVRNDEAENFLERAATRFGLNDRERTDFVSYWIPALLRNRQSLVQFLDTAALEHYAKLTVEPKPDAEIRLFMVFRRATDADKAGNPQIPELRRGKFTVVEWGGANLDE